MVDHAAKLLRIMYTLDLRKIQSTIDETIVRVQVTPPAPFGALPHPHPVVVHDYVQGRELPRRCETRILICAVCCWTGVYSQSSNG